jgi:hypothetical protein
MSDTEIRLIDVGDADAIAAHRARDADAFARWEPSRPADFYTADGHRERIEQLLDDHRNGDRWPGVVLADGAAIGQVTVSTILGEPFLCADGAACVALSGFEDPGRGSGQGPCRGAYVLEYGPLCASRYRLGCVVAVNLSRHLTGVPSWGGHGRTSALLSIPCAVGHPEGAAGRRRRVKPVFTCPCRRRLPRISATQRAETGLTRRSRSAGLRLADGERDGQPLPPAPLADRNPFSAIPEPGAPPEASRPEPGSGLQRR